MAAFFLSVSLFLKQNMTKPKTSSKEWHDTTNRIIYHPCVSGQARGKHLILTNVDPLSSQPTKLTEPGLLTVQFGARVNVIMNVKVYLHTKQQHVQTSLQTYHGCLPVRCGDQSNKRPPLSRPCCRHLPSVSLVSVGPSPHTVGHTTQSSPRTLMIPSLLSF